MTRTYSRPYVGIPSQGGAREVFRSVTVPTAESHPQFAAVIGPFRTKAGALYMAGPGAAFARDVAGAERGATNTEALARSVVGGISFKLPPLTLDDFATC